MKILVIGASGYLGSAIYQALSKRHTVVGTYFKNRNLSLIKLDITNKKGVFDLIKRENPQVIINCVGLVDECETIPLYGKLVNTTGTINIVESAKEIKAKIIFISSQAVFNGKRGKMTEEDEVFSITNYGKTKIEGEKTIETSGLKYLILRPSLIVGISPYGMKDRYFGKILKAIDEGKALKLDNTWKFAPSWNENIIEVIEWWVKNNENSRTVHVACLETTTKLQFAKKLAKSLKRDPNILKESKSKQSLNNNSSIDVKMLKKLGLPFFHVNKVIELIANNELNAKQG